MARAALLVAVLALAACGEGPTPPGQEAAAIGVPPGDALFASSRDARNFDGFADRFSTIDCTGLAASRAALRAEAEQAPRSTTGVVVGAVGALIGGPAGTLAGVIGSEATTLVSESGNLRLAAVEAVWVAKECDKPVAQRRATIEAKAAAEAQAAEEAAAAREAAAIRRRTASRSTPR